MVSRCDSIDTFFVTISSTLLIWSARNGKSTTPSAMKTSEKRRMLSVFGERSP